MSERHQRIHVETAVKQRYNQAARARESALCCPVDYNRQYLERIPQEVIDRDYGCGDPSRYLREGETVLDLGCGAGKICFIAAQVVGPSGRVIGVDMNDEMLALARKHQGAVGEALGYHNVTFRKGRIQDLALDLDVLAGDLQQFPIHSAEAFLAAEARAEELRLTRPLVAEETVDVVVSNCVLNLVDPAAKERLFKEVFRVLKRGGRAIISDIVSDEPVPEAMQQDPELWSGCISGAMTESDFLGGFERAGFYGIQLLEWGIQPWQVVDGLEFRAVTIEAFKGKQGPCFERHQAVIYKGPFSEVLDDDHHRFIRGQRQAVCDKTYQLLKKAPYGACFHFVDPRMEVPLTEAMPFDCQRQESRHPRETKGQDYRVTTPSSQCCDGGNGC